MKISVLAGARPNFMKIAPIVRALSNSGVTPRIVHTGQHYDKRMSQTFFDELQIPEPNVNLGVGSGSHVWQLAEIMQRLEPEFGNHPPDAVVVVGDVNSTVAGTLTASKLGIPVAHVEAGLRSFDRTMPEEINRLVTDAIADWLFTSEPSAEQNLLREGVPSERIHEVGNVMIDTVLSHLDGARALECHRQFQLEPKSYVLLTLHRPSNVDNPERLASILRAVNRVCRRLPVIFPMHPRTRARLAEFGFENQPGMNGFVAVEPLGYLSTLGLMDEARLVMTDSGGIQEETTALRVPCLTLRENTERPITVEVGSNRVIGWRTEAIVDAVEQIVDGPERTGRVPEFWDGHASERIAEALKIHFDAV